MRKLKEIGIGSFRPGREPQGKHTKSIDLMGPASNADGVIAQRQQYNVGNYDYDEDISYRNLGDQEEEHYDVEDTILECRVYRNGKYCLLETLNNIEETIDASDINMMDKKLANSAQRRKNMNIQSAEDYIEDRVDEFSGAAAGGGGPAVPVGYTAKGKPETPAQRRKRQRFNITKSYPYTKLANPPRRKRKRNTKKRK